MFNRSSSSSLCSNCRSETSVLHSNAYIMKRAKAARSSFISSTEASENFQELQSSKKLLRYCPIRETVIQPFQSHIILGAEHRTACKLQPMSLSRMNNRAFPLVLATFVLLVTVSSAQTAKTFYNIDAKINPFIKKISAISKADGSSDVGTADDVFIPFVARQVEPSPTVSMTPSPSKVPRTSPIPSSRPSSPIVPTPARSNFPGPPRQNGICSFPEYTRKQVRILKPIERWSRQVEQGNLKFLIRFKYNGPIGNRKPATVQFIARNQGRKGKDRMFFTRIGASFYSRNNFPFNNFRSGKARPFTKINFGGSFKEKFRPTLSFDLSRDIKRKGFKTCCFRPLNIFVSVRMCTHQKARARKCSRLNRRVTIRRLPCTRSSF